MKIPATETPVKEQAKTTTSAFKSISCPCLVSNDAVRPEDCQCLPPRTQSAIFPSESRKNEYPHSPANVTLPPNFQSYFVPLTQNAPDMMQQICSVGAATCPSPTCNCGCGCLPPPCNTPPKCIQYMTGYYYYPYGFWFCGPYHVTGTMCPGGPVCPGGPCGPCPPSAGGPCGPCNPGCVCAVLDPLTLGKPDSEVSNLDTSNIMDIFSKVCCVSLTAPLDKALVSGNPSGRAGPTRSICGPCCSPCKDCCGYGPCGPCGPCGPFGPCGTGFPGMSCGKCGPCGPCCGTCCGPCVPCGPCGPCCGSCGPCCSPCGPSCGPCGPCGSCGPCGPCCGVSCYPPCVPMCRPWCGPCVNCAVPPIPMKVPPTSQSMPGIVSSFGPQSMIPLPTHFLPGYQSVNEFGNPNQAMQQNPAQVKRVNQSRAAIHPRMVRKHPFSTTKEYPPENLQSRAMPLVNSTMTAYFSTLSDVKRWKGMSDSSQSGERKPCEDADNLIISKSCSSRIENKFAHCILNCLDAAPKTFFASVIEDTAKTKGSSLKKVCHSLVTPSQVTRN